MTNLAPLLKTKLNGNTFISISLNTDVKLNATLPTDEGRIPNPQCGKVTKSQTLVCQLFQNKVINAYEAKVRRGLIAEGKDPNAFQLGERKWGTRLKNIPVIEHNGEFYLEIIIHRKLSEEYQLSGKPIDKKLITGWPAGGKAAQGGLEKKVEIRSVKLSSIAQIHFQSQQLTDVYFEE